MSRLWPERALAALACLAGLLGVAASAAAAHVPGADTLKTAAQFLLFHAPAVIGLAGLSAAGLARPALARLAGGLLLVGLVLFSGDLALRALLARPLFAMAAPAGGVALMAGWLAGLACALVPTRRRSLSPPSGPEGTPAPAPAPARTLPR